VQLTLIFQEKLALLVEIDAVVPDAAELRLDWFHGPLGGGVGWGNSVSYSALVSTRLVPAELCLFVVEKKKLFLREREEKKDRCVQYIGEPPPRPMVYVAGQDTVGRRRDDGDDD
jgi:hypothetical protein